MNNVKKKEFALAPGVLRIAEGSLDRDTAEAVGEVAGVTDGGCVFRCEYRESDLTDTSGRVISTLKYGERVILEGELITVSPAALALLGGKKKVTAILTCPLPDGDSLTVNLRGAFPTAGKLALKRGGRVHFRILCPGDLSGGKMYIGESSRSLEAALKEASA